MMDKQLTQELIQTFIAANVLKVLKDNKLIKTETNIFTDDLDLDAIIYENEITEKSLVYNLNNIGYFIVTENTIRFENEYSQVEGIPANIYVSDNITLPDLAKIKMEIINAANTVAENVDLYITKIGNTIAVTTEPIIEGIEQSSLVAEIKTNVVPTIQTYMQEITNWLHQIGIQQYEEPVIFALLFIAGIVFAGVVKVIIKTLKKLFKAKNEGSLQLESFVRYEADLKEKVFNLVRNAADITKEMFLLIWNLFKALFTGAKDLVLKVIEKIKGYIKYKRNSFINIITTTILKSNPDKIIKQVSEINVELKDVIYSTGKEYDTQREILAKTIYEIIQVGNKFSTKKLNINNVDKLTNIFDYDLLKQNNEQLFNLVDKTKNIREALKFIENNIDIYKVLSKMDFHKDAKPQDLNKLVDKLEMYDEDFINKLADSITSVVLFITRDIAKFIDSKNEKLIEAIKDQYNLANSNAGIIRARILTKKMSSYESFELDDLEFIDIDELLA